MDKRWCITLALTAGIAGNAWADDAGKTSGTEMKPEFQSYDTNGDGEISKAEMSKAVDDQFAKADRNGDGTLDRTEFSDMAWHGRHHGAAHGQKMSRAGAWHGSAMPDFKDVDTNGDGRLSKTEAAAKLPGVDFARLDANQNGFVDRAEYRESPALDTQGQGDQPRKGMQDPASHGTRGGASPANPGSSEDPMNLE
jgi:Ca2+-binding EF-hand superfamily protein